MVRGWSTICQEPVQRVERRERMLGRVCKALILPIFLFHQKFSAECRTEWRLGKRQTPRPGSAVPGRLGGQGLSGRRWHCTSSKAIGMSSSRAFVSHFSLQSWAPVALPPSFSLSSKDPSWAPGPVGICEHYRTESTKPRGCSPVEKEAEMARSYGAARAVGHCCCCLPSPVCVIEVGKKVFLF